MSMSDCEKCWSTPCLCGWEYRHWSRQERIATAAAVLGVSQEFLDDAIEYEVPEEHPMRRKTYERTNESTNRSSQASHSDS